MQENYVVDPKVIDHGDCFYCRFCDNRIAKVDDYVPNVHDRLYGGYFDKLLNVYVIDQPMHTNLTNGNSLLRVKTYCGQCNNQLGWRITEVARPCPYYVEGRYLMKSYLLINQNRVTLHQSLLRGANEQAPNDPAGGAYEQAPNEQNADTDGVPNVDQDGGTNADQGRGANEQNADQDGGTNADQDRSTNEQNADQVGGNQDQDGGANEQNHDQVGGAKGQDGGANKRNHDQDGGPPTKQMKM